MDEEGDDDDVCEDGDARSAVRGISAMGVVKAQRQK